jgi:hypothetical protein
MQNSNQTNQADHLTAKAAEETQALLQLLAIGEQEVAEGKVERYEDVAQELRTELKAGRLGG